MKNSEKVEETLPTWTGGAPGKYMDVSKNSGHPQMDGENNGKPYEQMDDWGFPIFLETPIWKYTITFED